MPDIFDAKITAKNFKTIWERNQEDRPPFVGEMFFTPVSQTGLDINLVKGKNGVPVALVAANWDTDVLYRDRIGFEALQAEMPFFKEAYKTSEKLRQQIITVQEQYRQPLFNEIFNDVEDLLLGADVTAERLRMQLIGTGTISIQENGVDKQYNYGVDSSTQMNTESTLWSATSAKPLKTFIDRIKAYEDLTDEKAKYAVMGKAVLNKLIHDSTVDTYFQNLSTPDLYPTDEARQAYVEQKTGVKIILAKQKYVKARDKNKTKVSYYPEDRYTLLSTLDLGETIYGTTPEEIDLLGGLSKAATVEVVGNGVAITTWKETDPVCNIVKVSEVVLPSCPNIDQVYIVKVL